MKAIIIFGSLLNLSAVLGAAVDQRSTLTYTNDVALTKILVEGIFIESNGDCFDKTKKTCTSLDGIRQDTINGAISLKKSCMCDLTITGGTEVGHAAGPKSHANGYKLDFKITDSLTKYLEKTATRIADRPDGPYPQYIGMDGNTYCNEKNHWDVTFL